ncbi:hypothetical protein ACFVRU_43895 [Streptomyces sp. NPDC057927]
MEGFKITRKTVLYILLISGMILVILTAVLGIDNDLTLVTSIGGMVCIVAFFYLSHRSNIAYGIKENDDCNEVLKKLGYNRDDLLIEAELTKAIYINEEKSTIDVLQRKSREEEFIISHFKFKDILDVSVETDGQTISKVAKGELVGGALVGGLIGGGIGGIIGASGASKSMKETIQSVKFKITVNSLSNPIILLDIISLPNALDKNDYLLKQVIEECDKWFNIFTVILKRNEMNSKTS